MFWDSINEGGHYDEEDATTICLDFIDGKCKRAESCGRAHSQRPYLWQSALDDVWHDMPLIHSAELEKAYSTFYRNGVRLSPVDNSTSERYFPDDVVCYVNFNIMNMTFGSQVVQIRRLSTVSDKLSPHNFATKYAWYFKDENDKWIKYGETNGNVSSKKSATLASSDDIELAFCQGKSSLQISSKRHQYIINFKKMQQMNTETKIVREIRRRPCGVSADFQRPTSSMETLSVESFEWQFMDSKGKWTTFGADSDRRQEELSLSQEIENQFQLNPDSVFDYNTNRNRYSVDFQEKIVTNLKSGLAMPVRRIQSDGNGKIRHNSQPRNSNENSGWTDFDDAVLGENKGCFRNSRSSKTERKSFRGDSSYQARGISNRRGSVDVRGRRGSRHQSSGVTRSGKPQQRGRGFGSARKNRLQGHHSHDWNNQEEYEGSDYMNRASSQEDKSYVQQWANSHFSSASETFEDFHENFDHSSSIRSHDFDDDVSESSSSSSHRSNLKKSAQSHTSCASARSDKRNQNPEKKKKSNINSSTYEWFYRGPKDAWIKYGSTEEDIINSEDLETHFRQNPNEPLNIICGETKYVIDFDNRSQKNESTKSQVAICRAIANTVTAKKTKISFKNKASRSSSSDSSAASDSPISSYEWFFLDDEGSWVKFGEMSSTDDENCVTTITSDDIEHFYCKNPSKKMDVESGGHKYALDFKEMIQTNKRTGAVRPLWRTVSNSASKISKAKSPNSSSGATGKLEWFFLDDKKCWVRFGDTNSGDSSHATNLTSDDIEKHYLQNPNKPLDIENKHNKYILDFQSMTQINKQTKVARAVWRTTATNAQPKPNSMKPTSHQSASSGSKYAWYFQNDKNGWTKFGDSSSGDPSFATNLSSDDIEKHYSQNPTTPLHVENQFNKYVLDLVKMTQMNKKSKVLRPLWRTTADNNKSTMGSSSDDEEYEWFFQDDKNNWTKFGESSSGDRSHATNLTSRDIEKHYQSNKFKPLDIENQHNKYVLDLNKMTQTNKKTNVMRPLWRTSAKAKNSEASNASNQFAWFFQDQKKGWVKLDDFSSGGVKLSSEFIEKHFAQNPDKPLDINDGVNKYVLDLKKLTKTDKNTNAVTVLWRTLVNTFSGNSNAAEYEWFFMDDQDNWVKYGNTSSTDSSGNTTSITSKDIEKAFQSDQTKPFNIKSNNHSYVLDFKSMTQTNMQTNKVRAISRVLQNTSLIKKTTGNSNQASSSAQPNSKPAEYEWFFMDDQDSWVKYNVRTFDNSGNVINITSKDIEKAFQTDQSKPFNINGNNHSYVLDFKSMTQTNKQTNTVRAISRVLQNTSLIKKTTGNSNRASSSAQTNSKPAQYEWFFMDDQDSWVKYNISSTDSSGNSISITSRDIENAFQTDQSKPFNINGNNHSHVLDFKSMTQTNKQTNTVRAISRVLQNTSLIKKNATSSSNQTSAAKKVAALYEWYFLDDKNNWIKYGAVSTGQDSSCVTQCTSDDIERFYNENPGQTFDIQSSKHSYVLDFQKMTQTNKNTNAVRTIQRVRANTQPSASKNTVSATAAAYEWFFLDENNSWIKYGQVSSSNDSSLVTTTTSDDIEKQYNIDSSQCFDIQSSHHSYTINFKNMTQTNKNTNVVRQIKRVQTANHPSSSSTASAQSSFAQFSAGPFVSNRHARPTVKQPVTKHEWFFLDEQNAWIKYGQVSSANDSSCVTLFTSDQIEQSYLQNPQQSITIKSSKHTYVLDFAKMTQTNMKTLVARAIKRAPANTIVSGGPVNVPVHSVINTKESANAGFPSYWTQFKKDALTTVTLTATDGEYQKYLSFIKKTFNSIQIISMVRIQNPHLWIAFVNRCDQLRKKNTSIRYREEYLFHGTDSANIKSISEDNFDWRRAGNSVGTMYGQGTYFSNNASISNGYSRSSPKCMFIARVLIGKTAVGNGAVKRPLNDCDTSVDNTSQPSIFVKYDTQEYYPEYYVQYR